MSTTAILLELVDTPLNLPSLYTSDKTPASPFVDGNFLAIINLDTLLSPVSIAWLFIPFPVIVPYLTSLVTNVPVIFTPLLDVNVFPTLTSDAFASP